MQHIKKQRTWKQIMTKSSEMNMEFIKFIDKKKEIASFFSKKKKKNASPLSII
jgi:hypothetical protein